MDTVILTHLHGDHAGGCTRWDSQDGGPGPVVPVFPNATYLVQRIDLADASYPNERTVATYFPDNWEPLAARGQLRVIDGPKRLGSQVRTDVAPGHTAAIQTVWVEAKGRVCYSWAMRAVGLCTWTAWPGCRVSTFCP